MAEAFDADSVAALIFTPDERYVLQLRDRAAGVDFPGHWGLFGGALEPDETPEEALHRELAEELAIAASPLTPFSIAISDERVHGGWYCRRRFYELPIEPDRLQSLELHEGVAFAAFSIGDICDMGDEVIPFDLCAILMHARREVSRQTLLARRRGEGSSNA